MLLFIGIWEMLIGLPILVAAIIATPSCTPTTIAMASWTVLHGLIGTATSVAYLVFRKTLATKRVFRLIYIYSISIGIAIALAAAIHGGVGRNLGKFFDGKGILHYYYNYDLDVFFGVFDGIFEIMALLGGIWFLHADKRKLKESQALVNTPRTSFARLPSGTDLKETNGKQKGKK